MTESPHVGARRVLALGLVRARLELLALVRSKDAVVFSLALPLMLLVLFGAIFSDTLEGTQVTVGQWFTPGIIAASVLSAGFVNLATSMAIERHDGTLRRLALTPLPVASYLIGKVALTLTLAVGMTAALLGVGVAAFDVDLPTDSTKIMTFAWVFTLGVAAAAVLGIALASLPRSTKSAAVVFTPPFLFLQFVSGVFIEFNSIPSWMRTIAGAFPLRWLAAGMRSVFLPAEFEAVAEPGGSYHLGIGATVLIAWVIVGFAAATRSFRFGRERAKTSTVAAPSRLRRWRLPIVAALVLLVGAGAVLGPRVYEAFSLLNSGEEVDVGGRTVFIRCSGSGEPTVILEHGLGSNGHEWIDVQERLDDTHRVCFVSRAGMGFSDPAPQTIRTAQDAVDDLSAVLEMEAIDGPLVLVGHSFGGFVVRLFAAQHPETVAGMVLVDSAHEEQAAILQRELSPTAWGEVAGLYESAVNPERMDFVASAAQVAPHRSLGGVPLVVLEAGDQALEGGGISPASASEIEAVMAEHWPIMQADLSSLSTDGRHEVVADSGHFIQREQPDAVAAAISSVLERR